MFLTKVKDPAFWQAVREKESYRWFREDLLQKWERYGTEPIRALKFSDYQLFFTTGDRSVYENEYYIRRQALNCAALLAMIYPDEEQYLHRLEDIIYIICDEYTWCVPAHQPNITENIPDHLDLFATETGFTLSEIYTILGERLAPLIRERIRYAVDTRIIASYTDGRHYWWEKSNNNWAAVCMAGVAAAVMYMRPELFESLLPRFDETMKYFLSGFGDDGFCVEGLGYWQYGYGFFVCYADLLRDFTNGKRNYFADPKVASIATFGQKVFLSGKSTISFSDGSRRSGQSAGMAHYLHAEYGDAIELVGISDTASLASGCARWCLDIRKIVWFDENKKETPLRSEVTYYAPDAEWYIHKTPYYGFAAKGGNNNESHNHNDIGNFILAADGKQVFCDFGAGRYTRQYFRSETRYLDLHCTSFGHSVPYFGTAYQKPGAKYRAEDARMTEDGFTLELAPAYGMPELGGLRRTFRLGERTVELVDQISYTGDAPVTERFALLEKPELTDGGFTVAGMQVQYEGVLCASISPAVFEEHGLDNRENQAYFVDLTLPAGATTFRMTVTL